MICTALADFVTLLESPIDELYTRIAVCEHNQGSINDITTLKVVFVAFKT